MSEPQKLLGLAIDLKSAAHKLKRNPVDEEAARRIGILRSASEVLEAMAIEAEKRP